MASRAAIIKQSIKYLDALSQGVDPIEGKALQEGEALNSDRLRRCFAYVAGVLREELRRETSQPPPSSIKAPPAPARPAAPAVLRPGTSSGLEPDVAVLLAEAGIPACLTVSEEPLELNVAVRAISDAMEAAGLKRLGPTLVGNWMKSEGLMLPPADGTPDWTISPQAKLEGFLPPENAEGEKKQVRCTAQAQRYLGAHLEEILRLGQAQYDRLLESFTPGRLAGLAFSQDPISISKVAALLNSILLPDAERKLAATTLTDWLKKEGYLTDWIASETSVRRVPTQEGRRLGITQWTDGRSTPLYSEEAQRYIAEHIADIIGYARSLRKYPKCPAFFVPQGLDVAFSAEPISILRFQQKLDNALMASGGVPLQEGLITFWLSREGYLETVQCGDKKNRKLPTNQGEAIGIVAVEDGEHIFVNYSEPAQRFIVAHLAEIAACLPGE